MSPPRGAPRSGPPTVGTAGIGRGSATAWSLSLWQQLKEAAVPVATYWLLLLFCFATFASVVLGTDGASLDNTVLIGLCALATFPGVILGQILAFARVRSWLVVLFGAACWAVGLGAAIALSTAFGELGAFIALFLFVLPIALTGGLWSLETHRAVWSTWLPFLYTIAAVINWAEAQGSDANWFAGNKWAIWDVVSLAALGISVLLVLLYLVSRETHRLALWRRGPRAPLAPVLLEKGAVRPRLTIAGGCLLLILSGGLTLATAAVSPYLWRTGEGDRETEQPSEAPQEQPPSNGCDREPTDGPGDPKPAPPEDAEDQQELMDKMVKALQEATSTLCSLLTLALLAILGVVIGGPPIRRLLVVRHLRDPLWRVPPTARIEQGWRLVEIALGDAGLQMNPGEDAHGLARRALPVLQRLSPVEVHGLEDAAEVADRVRFGLGVSAEDVATMDRFAAWSYDTVWERLSDGEQLRCMYRPL